VSGGQTGPKDRRSRKPLWIAGASAIVVLIAAAALAGGPDDAGTQAASSSTSVASTTTARPTTTTEPTTTTTRATTTTTAPLPVDRSNYANVVAEPLRFAGSPVTIGGRVFSKPEIGSAAATFQMFAAPDSEWNTYVTAPVGSLPPGLDSGSFVIVTGTIAGRSSGVNAFGGLIGAVQIQAAAVTVADATALLGAPLTSLPLGMSIDQHGLVITLERLDVYVDRVLAHISVTNASGERARIYEHTVKVVQGASQLDYVMDWELPRWQSELLPGVATTAMVRFDVFDVSQPFELVLEAWSENYRLQFDDYRYSIGY
jgi:hypothetical protein